MERKIKLIVEECQKISVDTHNAAIKEMNDEAENFFQKDRNRKATQTEETGSKETAKSAHIMLAKPHFGRPYLNSSRESTQERNSINKSKKNQLTGLTDEEEKCLILEKNEVYGNFIENLNKCLKFVNKLTALFEELKDPKKARNFETDQFAEVKRKVGNLGRFLRDFHKKNKQLPQSQATSSSGGARLEFLIRI